jgi:ABC-2 type transport system ATP-binding protein
MALVEWRAVTKWYGPVLALDQVSLRLGPGITGLVGPNGSGKTTLLRLATGLARPDSGSVWVAGLPAATAQARRYVGYVPEMDALPQDCTGRKFLLILAGLSSRTAASQVETWLATLDLTAVADRRIGSYSKGMRQRLKLAQALLHEPRVLLCDEPFNGVDASARQQLQALFRQLAGQGRAVVLSSHQLDELERLADQLVILGHGRVLAQGSLAETRACLEAYPLRVQIDTPQPRQLAGWLLQLPMVQSVELAGTATLQVRIRQPQQFFRDLQHLVLAKSCEVNGLQILDASAEAVLQYLLADRIGKTGNWQKQ